MRHIVCHSNSAVVHWHARAYRDGNNTYFNIYIHIYYNYIRNESECKKRETTRWLRDQNNPNSLSLSFNIENSNHAHPTKCNNIRYSLILYRMWKSNFRLLHRLHTYTIKAICVCVCVFIHWLNKKPNMKMTLDSSPWYSRWRWHKYFSSEPRAIWRSIYYLHAIIGWSRICKRSWGTGFLALWFHSTHQDQWVFSRNKFSPAEEAINYILARKNFWLCI